MKPWEFEVPIPGRLQEPHNSDAEHHAGEILRLARRVGGAVQRVWESTASSLATRLTPSARRHSGPCDSPPSNGSRGAPGFPLGRTQCVSPGPKPPPSWEPPADEPWTASSVPHIGSPASSAPGRKPPEATPIRGWSTVRTLSAGQVWQPSLVWREASGRASGSTGAAGRVSERSRGYHQGKAKSLGAYTHTARQSCVYTAANQVKDARRRETRTLRDRQGSRNPAPDTAIASPERRSRPGAVFSREGEGAEPT